MLCMNIDWKLKQSALHFQNHPRVTPFQLTATACKCHNLSIWSLL